MKIESKTFVNNHLPGIRCICCNESCSWQGYIEDCDIEDCENKGLPKCPLCGSHVSQEKSNDNR